jgi:hypothetical protein
MTAPEAPAREALRALDIAVQQFDAVAEPLHGAPGMAVMLRRTRRELIGNFPVAMDERSRETPAPLNRPDRRSAASGLRIPPPPRSSEDRGGACWWAAAFTPRRGR